MDSEFEIPALRSIPIDRLLPGDKVWGWENDTVNRNVSRKGWVVDRDPIIVKELIIHYEFMVAGECAWTLNHEFVGVYRQGILALIEDTRKMVKHEDEDFDDVTSINHDRCEDI